MFYENKIIRQPLFSQAKIRILQSLGLTTASSGLFTLLRYVIRDRGKRSEKNKPNITLFKNDSIVAGEGKSGPISFALQTTHPKWDALRDGQTEKMRGGPWISGLTMIQQVLDRHQIGQAFHDFFSTLAAFATTIVATEFQLLCPIEKLLPYKAKIFLVHHFSKPTKMLLRKLEAEKNTNKVVK